MCYTSAVVVHSRHAASTHPRRPPAGVVPLHSRLRRAAELSCVRRRGASQEEPGSPRQQYESDVRNRWRSAEGRFEACVALEVELGDAESANWRGEEAGGEVRKSGEAQENNRKSFASSEQEERMKSEYDASLRSSPNKSLQRTRRTCLATCASAPRVSSPSGRVTSAAAPFTPARSRRAATTGRRAAELWGVRRPSS